MNKDDKDVLLVDFSKNCIPILEEKVDKLKNHPEDVRFDSLEESIKEVAIQYYVSKIEYYKNLIQILKEEDGTTNES